MFISLSLPIYKMGMRETKDFSNLPASRLESPPLMSSDSSFQTSVLSRYSFYSRRLRGGCSSREEGSETGKRGERWTDLGLEAQRS